MRKDFVGLFGYFWSQNTEKERKYSVRGRDLVVAYTHLTKWLKVKHQIRSWTAIGRHKAYLYLSQFSVEHSLPSVLGSTTGIQTESARRCAPLCLASPRRCTLVYYMYTCSGRPVHGTWQIIRGHVSSFTRNPPWRILQYRSWKGGNATARISVTLAPE